MPCLVFSSFLHVLWFLIYIVLYSVSSDLFNSMCIHYTSSWAMCLVFFSFCIYCMYTVVKWNTLYLRVLLSQRMWYLWYTYVTYTTHIVITSQRDCSYHFVVNSFKKREVGDKIITLDTIFANLSAAATLSVLVYGWNCILVLFYLVLGIYGVWTNFDFTIWMWIDDIMLVIYVLFYWMNFTLNKGSKIVLK